MLYWHSLPLGRLMQGRSRAQHTEYTDVRVNRSAKQHCILSMTSPAKFILVAAMSLSECPLDSMRMIWLAVATTQPQTKATLLH